MTALLTHWEARHGGVPRARVRKAKAWLLWKEWYGRGYGK
jgi:hypothetical protein